MIHVLTTILSVFLCDALLITFNIFEGGSLLGWCAEINGSNGFIVEEYNILKIIRV